MKVNYLFRCKVAWQNSYILTRKKLFSKEFNARDFGFYSKSTLTHVKYLKSFLVLFSKCFFFLFWTKDVFVIDQKLKMKAMEVTFAVSHFAYWIYDNLQSKEICYFTEISKSTFVCSPLATKTEKKKSPKYVTKWSETKICF